MRTVRMDIGQNIRLHAVEGEGRWSKMEGKRLSSRVIEGEQQGWEASTPWG